MAKCDICSKKTLFGNNVSHSVRRTKRSWKPNIRKVRVVTDNGTKKTMSVCAGCLRSNKVTRAI
jgi:large subunit ribosomal protein L28